AGARSVTSYANRDEAWDDVVRGIRAAFAALDQLAPPAPSPYDPWTPAMPPLFAGRGAILRGLEEALEARRRVSLVGDFRIGKSSVLKTWEQRAQAAGRVVTSVSGEEASGQSPGAFVHAVTGLRVPEDSDAAADALGRWAADAAPRNLPPIVLV